LWGGCRRFGTASIEISWACDNPVCYTVPSLPFSLPTPFLPMALTKQLQAVLDKRQEILKLRRLVVNPPDAIDFSSNDFLGLARSKLFRDRFLAELQAFNHPPLGSTGSRCLDGNSQYALDLEARIAKFHHAEAALLFNSGFDANSGLFSTIPQPGDIIFYDELIHASVHEGMKLSRAGMKIPFKHNCMTDLESKIIKIWQEDKSANKPRNVFVAVETVYSMDGDVPPLQDMVTMLRRYWTKEENGYIIVDEVKSLPNRVNFIVLSTCNAS
jgi:8-amino-7-oxononanoate synthase